LPGSKTRKKWCEPLAKGSGSKTRAPLDDEDRRLLAIFRALRADEEAAAQLISNPQRSLLFPTYRKLVENFEGARFVCNLALLDFRMRRKR
jgi:hypothetical protein